MQENKVFYTVYVARYKYAHQKVTKYKEN